jgi:hypothetical protein
MEWIKYLLRLIFEAIFCGTIWNLYSKSFNNPSSQWYYKKILESIKVVLFGLSVLLVLRFLKFKESVGLIKPANKQFYLMMACALTLIIVVMAVAMVKSKEDRNKGSQ